VLEVLRVHPFTQEGIHPHLCLPVSPMFVLQTLARQIMREVVPRFCD
jgi:hypothetical protein